VSELIGHALLPVPTEEQVREHARMRRGGGAGAAAPHQGEVSEAEFAAAAAELLDLRAKVIAEQERDPYRFGWEPSIWKVCDALIDFPWCDDAFVDTLKARFPEWPEEDGRRKSHAEIAEGDERSGPASPEHQSNAVAFDWWEAFKVRMRRRLGFAKRVLCLLILGGNRTSKSNYAAKRGQMMLSRRLRSRVTAFHMSDARSVEEQQPLFWHYMPPEWRGTVKGSVEYVSYKEKVGFSEGGFLNRIGSRCGFKNYEQDRSTAIEGKSDDLMLPDELVPADWVETMVYRLADRAERGAAGVITFTPLEGYSLTVKKFLDGAVTALEVPAPLLPRDGLAPDVAAALGLCAEDFAEIQAATLEKRPAFAAQSEPEDCLAWLDVDGTDGTNGADGDVHAESAEGDESGTRRALRPLRETPKRVFEMVPRVMRPVDSNLGVVFFHCRDNPFGNPKEVISLALGTRSAAEVRVRCYGKAEKSFANVLVKFDARVHVLPDAAIPRGGENFMMMDPAGDRNCFMLWLRRIGDMHYVYREWPGVFEIPGQGVPGPWAVPSARLKGRNDGDRGEGQRTFGWGLSNYKLEMARLELWDDFLEWLSAGGAKSAGGGLEGISHAEIAESAEWRAALGRVASGELVPEWSEVEEWDDRSSVEPVVVRIVDSRAASNPRMGSDQPVTLYNDMLDAGLNVTLAPGGPVIGDARRMDGIQPVVKALEFSRDAAQSFFNSPHLFIAESCRNTIFAMSTWMNVEGQKGACKDPIDCLRMFFLSEFAEGAPAVAVQAGFAYGRNGQGERRGEVGRSKLARWKGSGRAER
jgi:hypothetical protein